MNPNDPRVDRVIANALRVAGSEKSYGHSLEDLAARIDGAAAPLLAARRNESMRPFAWWDYAADWARALIPASVIVAAASVGFLWMLRSAEARPLPSMSPIAAAVRPCHDGEQTTAACAPAAVVNQAIEELVSMNDVPSRRRSR
jgi:hypothetical protein